ncbi:S8 family serine peptidase [Paenibacillus chartarius]|uniref:S8 family serine peptidase n=1 Tax=Paenibacillus chartarius TaxID=747481 RepID=A0ABV6DUS0_9BACL
MKRIPIWSTSASVCRGGDDRPASRPVRTAGWRSMLRRAGMLLAGLAFSAIVAAAPASAADPAQPNDPLRSKQTYLDQIHMPEAWASGTVPAAAAPIVVALVDTGVDLTHTDLQGKLVDGFNVLNPSLPPQDDNGHGTNVAGIIAAVNNNDKGIAGIASGAVRIMPIKALEADGRGDENKLGEGIRYAVDHGARIVVLSLGLNRDNEELAKVVRYAEDRGVLLVAAVGNEGNSVNYPAAYPTVLAVGGVNPYNQAEYRSNVGPEIDLVAPYDVYTTALGGGYESKNGTSMAAPQAAAVAALAWTKYTWMQPYQLRSLLQQTAEDLEEAGWDELTGYGLLRADRALRQTYREDPFEPNDQADTAKVIPVNTAVSAELAGGQDTDWFKLVSPYSGTLQVRLDLNDPGAAIAVTTYTNSLVTKQAASVTQGETLAVPVDAGVTYIRLQAADSRFKTSVSYRLTTALRIYEDPYEPNDKQFQAFSLPAQSQVVKGTFDHANDVDWYVLQIDQSGRLAIRLSTDTARIDPVLLLEKRGEKGVTYDQAGNGAEEATALDVFPGQYYLKVSNLNGAKNAIVGEYTLSITYTPKWLDPNEPNDKPYQASAIDPGTAAIGTFETAADTDWFQLGVPGDSLAAFTLTGVPADRTVTLTLADYQLKPLGEYRTEAQGNDGVLQIEQYLTSGTYYIKLSTDYSFTNRPYRFEAGLKPLISGYTDIANHWAQATISRLSEQHIIEGYGHYSFRPDGAITRAEAAAVLTRAFRWSKEDPLHFTDVPVSYWAYPYIAKAAQAGIVDGYADASFRPDLPITRMEMASMFAKSLNLAGKRRGGPPFTDVGENYWGAGILKQLKADGWLTGFPDGTFGPERQASRAEFLTILEKILNR